MFDLCDLASGSLDVGDWILGIQGRPECEGFGGAPYPSHLNLMSLSVLMSLGNMPPCRHPFMYAQEATVLPLLLETEWGIPD